jgi:hypothetical protein
MTRSETEALVMSRVMLYSSDIFPPRGAGISPRRNAGDILKDRIIILDKLSPPGVAGGDDSPPAKPGVN